MIRLKNPMTTLRTGPIVFGFPDDRTLAKVTAQLLRCPVRIVSEDRYPAGEYALRIGPSTPRHAIIAASVGEQPSCVFRTLVLAHALRDIGARRVDLIAPWIAYGRQDHTDSKHAGIGLAVGRELAQTFDRIASFDAHSPRFIRSFQRHLINILPDPPTRQARLKFDVVMAPDTGSRERAERMAKRLGVKPMALNKRRDQHAGLTVAFRNDEDKKYVRGARILLVDDMADSGTTLRSALHLLHKAGVGSLHIFVTHAFDLAALRRHLRPFCHDICATVDHTSGKLDMQQLMRLVQALKIRR